MIPLWLKIVDTLFVYLIVPIYWRRYGPANFLWFSDVALLLTVPALWLESPLLVSMMALAVALPELAWNIDFFVRLTTGVSLLGLAAYMFDRRIPRFVRSLSLFHVGLRRCSFGCCTGSATTSAPSLRKRLSRSLYCHSRISSATRARISTGSTALVKNRRPEFPHSGF